MARLNQSYRAPVFPPQGPAVAPARWEPSNTHRTHEGAPAASVDPVLALRRSVSACLLWEDEFYESGTRIADRITQLVAQVPHQTTADLAVDARRHLHLRHAPLLLTAALARVARGTSLVSRTLDQVIQRADELTEFLAIYARLNGVQPSAKDAKNGLKSKLSAQVKLGLAHAFQKFDAYQLSKYDRAGSVRLRDVLFLTHPSPRDPDQAALWASLIDGTIPSPDTWEVALSSALPEGTASVERKREVFTRLLEERKLGYLALLRNLRNMTEAGVDPALVAQAILARRGAHRVLSFRYVAASRAVPSLTAELDQALIAAIDELPLLPGRTGVLVDVSGSMDVRLSARSDLTRADAAAALASLVRCESLRVFTFSDRLVELAGSPRGLAGIQAVLRSQSHRSTYLGKALIELRREAPELDRLLLITDEQSHDHVGPPPCERGYLINVASNQHGVGYGSWVHLDGFSEQVIRWVHEYESLSLSQG